MGGSYGAPKPEKTGKMLQAYQQYLPGVLRATSAEVPRLAADQFAATALTEPAYQQLNADLTAEFAPQLAEVNSQVQRINAIRGAETNVAQLEGPGRDAAIAADRVAREANPNYYKVADAASNKAAEMLGSFNLNGLSPGEANAVERSLNQTNTSSGNLGLTNPTNIIANAMNFGGAFNNKVDRLNNALQTANSTATSSQNTGFNPVNIALGQPNVGNQTQFQQSGAQGGASQGALGFGQGLLSNQFGMNSAAISGAYSRANANSIPAYMGAMPSYS